MSTPFPSAPMASPVVTGHPAAAPRSAPAPVAAKPATQTTPKRPPLMAQPRVQRVVYPVLVGLVLIALWQGLVTAMELPPYLVPSPILMMKTLFTDWAALG